MAWGPHCRCDKRWMERVLIWTSRLVYGGYIFVVAFSFPDMQDLLSENSGFTPLKVCVGDSCIFLTAVVNAALVSAVLSIAYLLAYLIMHLYVKCCSTNPTSYAQGLLAGIGFGLVVVLWQAMQAYFAVVLTVKAWEDLGATPPPFLGLLFVVAGVALGASLITLVEVCLLVRRQRQKEKKMAEKGSLASSTLPAPEPTRKKFFPSRAKTSEANEMQASMPGPAPHACEGSAVRGSMTVSGVDAAVTPSSASAPNENPFFNNAHLAPDERV